MATGATITRVSLVSVKIRETGGLAPHRESARVERTLQLRRTAGTKVNWTFRDRTTDVVGDSHWEIEPINEGHIIKIFVAVGRESELCGSCGGHTSSCMCVAKEAAVAAPIKARVRPWVPGEIAVTPSPDPSSLPIVWNSERNL